MIHGIVIYEKRNSGSGIDEKFQFPVHGSTCSNRGAQIGLIFDNRYRDLMIILIRMKMFFFDEFNVIPLVVDVKNIAIKYIGTQNAMDLKTQHFIQLQKIFFQDKDIGLN